MHSAVPLEAIAAARSGISPRSSLGGLAALKAERRGVSSTGVRAASKWKELHRRRTQMMEESHGGLKSKKSAAARGTPCPYFAYKARNNKDTLPIFRILLCFICKFRILPYFVMLYMQTSAGLVPRAGGGGATRVALCHVLGAQRGAGQER